MKRGPATPALRRTLVSLVKHGAAQREWYSREDHAWKWTVAGENTHGNVDRAILAGFVVVVGAERDRAVLTDRGRRVAA